MLELTDYDRRLMAGTRDRLLMEAIEDTELAITREAAWQASYDEVEEKLYRKTRECNCLENRCESLRSALWGAVALAGVFAVALLALAVAW